MGSHPRPLGGPVGPRTPLWIGGRLCERSGHLLNTAAGLRMPALHAASSASRTSLRDGASTPRVASRVIRRGGPRPTSSDSCAAAWSSGNRSSITAAAAASAVAAAAVLLACSASAAARAVEHAADPVAACGRLRMGSSSRVAAATASDNGITSSGGLRCISCCGVRNPSIELDTTTHPMGGAAPVRPTAARSKGI